MSEGELLNEKVLDGLEVAADAEMLADLLGGVKARELQRGLRDVLDERAGQDGAAHVLGARLALKNLELLFEDGRVRDAEDVAVERRDEPANAARIVSDSARAGMLNRSWKLKYLLHVVVREMESSSSLSASLVPFAGLKSQLGLSESWLFAGFVVKHSVTWHWSGLAS